PDAQKAALEYIKSEYGSEYVPEKPNFYKTKNSAQDAHEAIRPTSMDHVPEKIKKDLTPEQFKLYSLIWNRFLASQMVPAVYDQTGIDIVAKGSDNKEYTFRATGSVLKFAGFEKVYMTDSLEEETDEEKAEGLLPECSKTDPVSLDKINTEQKFTQPPARFSEASLIKELEEKGIGRPSTYASIISTIQDRGYVEKDAGQLKPVELGRMVNELLIGSFADIMDVEFTAGLEDKLDGVEKGDTDWVAVLKAFYKDFAKDLKDAEKNMRNVKKEETATDVVCPKCGEKMVIKWGRMGQFLACSKYPECKTTRNFTKQDDGDIKIQKAETTTEKCPECGGPMLVKQGRFGKFIACADYPKCKGTKSFTTGVKCPECGKGELGEKRTK
ncbi:MAG TPA: DNA topoisomerase, partial [bacterium]|nr:DNA topoisomerase [bacterium]